MKNNDPDKIIERTSFGEIVVNGEKYEKDIYINISGKIRKRKKKLSKKRCGTSHIISLEEAEYVYEKGLEELIIGTGQEGLVTLSPEARSFFSDMGCNVMMSPT